MFSRLVTKLMALAAAGALAACGGADLSSSAAAKKGEPKQAPKLNISHVECTDDGVEVHFVLLHFGSGNPGNLTFEWTDGENEFEETVQPGKKVGNVQHYTVYLDNGYIDITAANAGGASLHNPSEYAGEYQCNGNPECQIEVEETTLFCLGSPLGSEGAECGYFGLMPLGKDNTSEVDTFEATMDAYVAIVKSGAKACNPGETAYRVYVNVTAGDVLEKPVDEDGKGGAISHVTYCECPAE
jgi:hypothetical protein